MVARYGPSLWLGAVTLLIAADPFFRSVVWTCVYVAGLAFTLFLHGREKVHESRQCRQHRRSAA